MSKSTQEQLRFHPSNGKTIRADFSGGELLSDFGALLLRETILQSGLISRMAKLNNMAEPDRIRLYGEAEYQAKSWKGLDTRIIYKADAL